MANPHNLEFDTVSPWEGEGPLPRVQIKVPGFVWDCLEIGYRNGDLTPSPEKNRRLRRIINVGTYSNYGVTFGYGQVQIPGVPRFGVMFRKAAGDPGDVATRENLVMVFNAYEGDAQLSGNDAIARATAFLNALRPMFIDCRHKEIEPVARIGLPGPLTQKIVGMVRGERVRPEGPRVARPPRTLPPRRRAGDPEPAPGPAEPPERDPGGGTGPAAAGAPQGGRKKTRKPRRKSKKTLRRR